MELVGMVLIVAATGVLILWPLLRRTDSASAEIAIAPADRSREKEMALAAIRELEFDYATGKISPEDYAVLRARYEAKAAGATWRSCSKKRSPRRGARAAVCSAARACRGRPVSAPPAARRRVRRGHDDPRSRRRSRHRGVLAASHGGLRRTCTPGRHQRRRAKLDRRQGQSGGRADRPADGLRQQRRGGQEARHPP